MVKNTIFAEKTFVDYLLLPRRVPKDATPPNFAKKTFVNSHKITKSGKVFSLESFPLYGTLLLLLSYTSDCILVYFQL